MGELDFYLRTSFSQERKKIVDRTVVDAKRTAAAATSLRV